MATESQVISGIDAIADDIKTNRAVVVDRVIALLDQVTASLADIPTVQADVISTVNGYTPTGAFETLKKDELAKLTTEFQALSSAVASAKTALNGV